MKKQYAVFGLGHFGMSLAITLQENGCEVIAVDMDEARVDAIKDRVSYSMVADATSKEVIDSLDLESLDGAVVAIANHMESSIMTTLLLAESGVPYIVAKARSHQHAKILTKIGADKVVRPEYEMGYRTAVHIVTKNFEDWIELDDDHSIISINTPSAWVGKTLLNLNLRKKYGLNIVAVRIGGEVIVSMDPSAPIPAEAILTVVGSNEDLRKLSKV